MRSAPRSATPLLPFTGRSDEYRLLRGGLDRAAGGECVSFVVTGPEGSGKTRLVQAVMDEAERKGFLVASASGHEMEAEIPYAVFCDLLDPLVTGEVAQALTAFTRGAPEFQFVCPSLAVSGPRPDSSDAIPDLRNRLLWNFPQFLDRLRRDRPLLLVVEDVEWTDPSSRELMHFLARRAFDLPLMMVFTLDPEGSPGGATALEAVRSAAGRSGSEVRRLSPFEAADVVDLVSRGFRVDAEVVRDFGTRLHGWTGGNPLMVTEVLDSLVSSGEVRQEGGRWVGWSLDFARPPGTVRELVLRRIERLSPTARTTADLVSVIGTRARFDVLERAGTLAEADLLRALEELVAARVLREDVDGGTVFFAFLHPVVREVLYREISAVRARSIHAGVAKSLESLLGDRAIEHADALAIHVAHAGDAVDPARAAAYLADAGRQALAAHADREAVKHLERALALLPNVPPSGPTGGGADSTGEIVQSRVRLLEDLARAHQRLGHYREATRLLEEARALIARPAGRGLAALDRRLGLARFWAGHPEEAMTHWDRGLQAARAAGSRKVEAELRLARSACLQETARPAEAGEEASLALAIGEELGDLPVQVAAHLNLILLHAWTGPTPQARLHGEAAIRLARASGNRADQLTAHWAMAILEGLTGRPEPTRDHLNRAAAIADELGSPLLSLRLAELEIEYWSRMGDWDRGADVAAQSIGMARELNQRLNLARLLVVSGVLRVGRGEVEEARAEIDEAWEIAGASGGVEPTTTLTSILAYTGRAALHLAEGDYAAAIRVGKEGLALVDRTGYTAWAVQRFLPTLAEASLHVRDFELAESVRERFRVEAERLDLPLARAWYEIMGPLLLWRRGDPGSAAEGMAKGVEALDRIGLIPDAARLRRQLAGRLADLGDRDGAVRELRRVHDTLAGLGAEPELEKARGQFREVGARPPTRTTAPGTGLLTEREAEIVRLVGERKSNKAIAKDLGISPRTVGTHLSSVFKKLEVTTRTQLGDLVREGLLDRRG